MLNKKSMVKVGTIFGLGVISFVLLFAIAMLGQSAKATGIDANDVLILHFDGTNASTTFIDSSNAPHTMTSTSVAIETGSSKFGGASAVFTVDASTVGSVNSADWNLGGAGAGDFTTDFWIKPISSSPGWQGFFSTGGVQFYYENAQVGIWTGTGTDRRISWVIPTAGAWQHIALVRSGSTVTLYQNGNKTGTFADGDFNNDGGALNIGNAAYLSFRGDMDEFRISKGVARWTANFTVENAPYGFNCQFQGRVKDSDGTTDINAASVVIIDQSDDKWEGNTVTNSTGGWAYNITVVGNYTVLAYNPADKTKDADADPFVECK